MSTVLHSDSRDPHVLNAGTVFSLSYRGAIWAQASLNPDASEVTLGCRSLHDPVRFPSVVRVLLDATSPLECTIDPSVLTSWPSAPNSVWDRPLRGAAQLMRLVDPRGYPWAQIEIGDQVRLFDPSGRERARIIRSWDQGGGRLVLRCWDERGTELSHREVVPS
jgi:hypothetical protein